MFCNLHYKQTPTPPKKKPPCKLDNTWAVFTWARITFRKTFQNVIQPFPDLNA